jgi:hypothetical protein
MTRPDRQRPPRADVDARDQPPVLRGLRLRTGQIHGLRGTGVVEQRRLGSRSVHAVKARGVRRPCALAPTRSASGEAKTPPQTGALAPPNRRPICGRSSQSSGTGSRNPPSPRCAGGVVGLLLVGFARSGVLSRSEFDDPGRPDLEVDQQLRAGVGGSGRVRTPRRRCRTSPAPAVG